MSASAAASMPLPLLRSGKVREVYVVDDERLLLVASDRVSAFDVVMNERVPYKGAVLTQMTAWWLRQFGAGVEHHMLASSAHDIIAEVPSLAGSREALRGRAMLCRRTQVFPVECVVRGYLSGSAWKEYAATGTLAGEQLAGGLTESARFDPPIFSPATKAESGHDENIPVSDVRRLLGHETAAILEQKSRDIYARGRDLAAARGIIIADTKFEFGRDRDGVVRLIDEVLTPDSSRFWPAGRYRAGGPQPSFDKQPLRDYLKGESSLGAGMATLLRRRSPPQSSPKQASGISTRSSASQARHSTFPTLDSIPVTFAKEGVVLIIVAALVVAALYAIALYLRSWPLWLLAFLLTLVALLIAYNYRDPVLVRPAHA